MRFIGKSLLALSFITSFLFLLILITIRFQFLSSEFWINSFREGSVYTKLEASLGNSTRDAFIAQGASKREAEKAVKILTADILQEFTERNITNILDFANGTKGSLLIYFPMDKLPAEIRQSLEINSEEISLEYLLHTFGKSSTVSSDAFLQLKQLGNYMTISLVITFLSMALYIFLLYRLELAGNKLMSIASTLIASGVLGLIVAILLNSYTTSVAQSLLSGNAEPSQILLGVIAPAAVLNITKIWIGLSVVSIVLGIICIFTKKPGSMSTRPVLSR